MARPKKRFRMLCLVSMIALAGVATGGQAASAAADAGATADHLEILVRDAASGQPIPEFRAVAGTKSGGISDAFEKSSGKEIVNWQPHTIREGRDGTLDWPLQQAYDVMALRVEADGFLPARTVWIKKADGTRTVEVLMRQDSLVSGRVLQPDGKPAAKALLAVALPQKDAVLEDGRLRGAGQPPPEKLSDRWRRPGQYESDDIGAYRIPTETDAGAAILILHESGVAEMSFAKFAASSKLTLQAWGRVEGRVLWQDKPGVDEPVSLTIHRHDYGYPGTIAQYGKASTDGQGRFVFDRVLPGHAQVSRGIEVAEAGGGGASSWTFPGLFANVAVRSGDPTPMIIGGQGRKVTGRLTGRTAWSDVTFHFHPNAPRPGGFGADNTGWRAFGLFRSSPFGPLFFRDKLRPNADGTFEIPDMMPGRYQLFVSEGGVQGSAARTFEIEPEIPGEPPAAMDLGEIKLKSR